MKLLKGSTTLVIVGAWNPAILQPEWILKNALGVNPDRPIALQMEFGPGIGFLPRMSIDGITFVPAPDRISLILETPSQAMFEKAEAAARAILTTLKHTPVNGVGENFEFVESDPDQEALAVFDNVSDLPDRLKAVFESQSKSIVETVRLDGGGLLNLVRESRAGNLFLKFNFHHEVKSAEDAAAILDRRFAANWHIVSEILSSYGADAEKALTGE